MAGDRAPGPSLWPVRTMRLVGTTHLFKVNIVHIRRIRTRSVLGPLTYLASLPFSRNPPSRSLTAQAETTAELFDALRHDHADFSPPVWRGVSTSAYDLLIKILQKDPRKRISAEEILRHAWMQRYAPPSPLTSLSAPPPDSSSDVPTNTEVASRDCLPPLPGSESDREPSFEGGPAASGRSSGDSGGASASGDAATLMGRGNRVLESVPSARIFYAPDNMRLRHQLDGFVDAFKQQVGPLGAGVPPLIYL